MPTPDQNATTLSGAQFQALQANTLAELIGSPPQGATGGASEVLASEWDNGAITFGSTSAVGGVREANFAALQEWLDYCADNNKVAFLDGLVQFAGGTLDMRDRIFTLRGLNKATAYLFQMTDNIPLINIGETTANTIFTHSTIEDLHVRYGGAQPVANTSAVLIRAGQNYFGSGIRKVGFQHAYNGYFQVNGNIFSNIYESLNIENFSGYGMHFGGMGTGNVFDQIHIVGNTLSPPTCHAAIWFGVGTTNFMSQLNIEWLKVDQAGIYMNTCRNMVFDSVNLESIDPIGNVPLVRINGGTFGTSFHGLKVQTCEFTTANGCTAGAIFQSDGGQSVSVDGLHIQQTSKTGATFHIVGPKIGGGQVFSDVYYLSNVQTDSPDTPSLDGLENYTQNATYLGQSVIREYNGMFTPGYREALTDSDEDLYQWNNWSNLTPDIYFSVPLTAARTKTLKNTASATSTITTTLNIGFNCKIIRTAASTGAFPLYIANDEDAVLIALNTGSWATFHMNSNRTWVLDTWGGDAVRGPSLAPQGNLTISTTAPSVVVA